MNTIFPAVNTAIGQQISSRVDIAFKPRNSQADQASADTLSKVIMQICDDIKYPWLEKEVFSDGIIQRRGYLDFRIDFDENMMGSIVCESLDPLDVLPDPDAQSYDPQTWNDVMIMRWMNEDDIGGLYGKDKAAEVFSMISERSDGDEGEEDDRLGFGDADDMIGYTDEGGIKRVLVLDRQRRVYEMTECFVHTTGDVVPVPEMMSPEEAIFKAERDGLFITKRMIKKIKWLVTSGQTVLFDDWSPYRTLTIVPYFPYFRRGNTISMVDNLISPQELLNKMTSQYLLIVSTSANSGWTVEEDTLTNMKTADLEDHGADTGLVMEHKKGSNPPQKILPNRVPDGVNLLADKAEMMIKSISGISDALRGGENRTAISGVAKQTDLYQGMTQLAGPLDNLAHTRNMVGCKILELVQGFYTEERVIMITDSSDIANVTYDPLVINQEMEDGSILNDLTLGEYDVVITDQPTQATFQDNQFQQAMEMRKEGIAIPDPAIIEMSSLSKKGDIARSMVETEPPPDPQAEAKARDLDAAAKLKTATTEKVIADTVNARVETMYSGTQAAGAIAAVPTTAPMTDIILKSAGFEDQDEAPLMPNVPPATEAASVAPPPETILDDGIPTNTNPMTPANPGVGLQEGMETKRMEDNI